MENDLPKIDRWHSEPLDVHTWSDHPEIKKLCNDLYDDAGLTSLESKGKGNRNPKRTVKESLRVLILDYILNPLVSILIGRLSSQSG